MNFSAGRDEIAAEDCVLICASAEARGGHREHAQALLDDLQTHGCCKLKLNYSIQWVAVAATCNLYMGRRGYKLSDQGERPDSCKKNRSMGLNQVSGIHGRLNSFFLFFFSRMDPPNNVEGAKIKQIVTPGSQVVTQPTTGDAQDSFASGCGRERALSVWYEQSMHYDIFLQPITTS